MIFPHSKKFVLIKTFIFLFFVSLLLFNLKEIVLFSHYRVIKYNLENLENIVSSKEKEKTKNQITEKNLANLLLIPKLNVSAPIIPWSEKKLKDDEGTKKALKKGVLLFSFGKIGKKGTAIILGHSAPEGWPKIYYDHIFSKIGELKKGDEIYVYFNNKKYLFLVEKQVIFFPQQEDEFLPKYQKESSLLILVTCYPQGKDFQRLAVFARLAENS